jgi:RHS repeat-associated protein
VHDDPSLPSGNFSLSPANRVYTYDTLNRISTANSITYTFDRFGNRLGVNGVGPAYDANNRIASGYGYTYDAAGNVLNDGAHSYAYDAENRLIRVDNPSGTQNYFYDAMGRRVQTNTAAGTKDFLYDLGGHAVAELLQSGSALVWTRGEVYAAGQHLATYSNSTTYFDHNDWLGTERSRSTVTGTQYEICTSGPYGDNLVCQGQGGDASPLHFTGKQRDSESNLDYFGARYYASTAGRFISPDWSAKADPVPYAKLDDPQTLNLYSYVLNHPSNSIDPNGHDWFYVSKKWQWQKGHVYHDGQGNATKAKGYAGLLVATVTGTNRKGATTYSLTLYDQNKVVATGTGFSGNNNYPETGAIKDGNYQILGRFDPPPTAPNPASPDNNPPPIYGYQTIDPSINAYAGAVYQAYGPMRARLNPLDPSNTDPGVYFHGQFGDAFHSEGWTHGCLSYGRDTTMIDYMADHFGNAWTGVSVDTQVVKP